jgi:hypothetical protein
VKYFHVLVLLLMVRSASAQSQPAGNDDLRFILDKLRTDYAGYTDKVDTPAFGRLIREVQQSDSRDTFFLLSRLTGYFRDDHLAIFAAVKLTAADSTESLANLAAIERARQMAAAPPKPRTPPKPGKTPTQGYWLDELGNQVIFIRQTAPDRWEGDIVETRDKVPAGLRVLTLYRQQNGEWLADYTDADLRYRVVVPARLKEKDVLVGNCYFKYRLCPNYTPGLLHTKIPFSYEPSATRLDSQTLLIHMPYFIGSYAKRYDSLLKANAAALQQVSTLILDIRNNPGGSVRCYAGLLPWICTGPMKRANGYQLCSQDLIADTRSTLATYEKRGDSTRTGIYRKYLDTLMAHKDSFRLTTGGDSPCVAVPNSIRHVAILMDHGSRSAAELMVLYFRQSDKVRLFGENTAGAVDYLDLLTFELPHSRYEFWVASTRRQLSGQDPAYDTGGIPPDTPIPDSEPDWIGFVQKYYSNHTDKP